MCCVLPVSCQSVHGSIRALSRSMVKRSGRPTSASPEGQHVRHLRRCDRIILVLWGKHLQHNRTAVAVSLFCVCLCPPVIGAAADAARALASHVRWLCCSPFARQACTQRPSLERQVHSTNPTGANSAHRTSTIRGTSTRPKAHTPPRERSPPFTARPRPHAPAPWRLAGCDPVAATAWRWRQPCWHAVN